MSAATPESRQSDLDTMTNNRRNVNPGEKLLCPREKYRLSGLAHRCSAFVFHTCAMSDVVLDSISARSSRRILWEDGMTWKTPKIVEVPVGMEINMYACAARK
jgi:coenzyme PQQ precursor peptide PqqA